MKLDNMTFGLVMTVVGVGGTFLTLTLLIWSIEILKKIFPLESGKK